MAVEIAAVNNWSRAMPDHARPAPHVQISRNER
jgi:hypothetical protein